MPGPIEQEFHLERTDEFYGIGDPTTSIRLRKTGAAESDRHEQFLEELKGKVFQLIDPGSKSRSPLYATFCTDTLWHLRSGNPHPKKRIIDDRLHRYQWGRDFIQCKVRRFEIELLLAACNLLNENKRPIFTFTDGRLDRYPSLDFGDTSLSLFEAEIHEKVLEVNPDWKGSADILCSRLIQEHHLEELVYEPAEPGAETVFSTSENYLYSLLEEINRAVFNGIGKIRAEIVEEGPRKGSAEGFRLFIPKNNWNPNNLGYIALRENGRQEIRIVVKRDKSDTWDMDLSGVVDGLQQAIIWWKECGEYTEEERLKAEEDEMRLRLEKEGKALLDEKRNAT
jgi:hypothetical protein